MFLLSSPSVKRAANHIETHTAIAAPPAYYLRGLCSELPNWPIGDEVYLLREKVFRTCCNSLHTCSRPAILRNEQEANLSGKKRWRAIVYRAILRHRRRHASASIAAVVSAVLAARRGLRWKSASKGLRPHYDQKAKYSYCPQ